MSEQKMIPIMNKSTGEITFGTPLHSLSPNLGQDSVIANQRESDLTADTSPKTAPSIKSGSGQAKNRRTGVVRQEEQSSGTYPKDSVRQKIENIEQFIAHAYARRGQKLALSTALEKQLCRQPKLDAVAKARLLDLAQADVMLAVPRQLLLVVRDLVGFPMLKNTVREFVGEVLAGHPIFLLPELSAVLKNLVDAPSPEEAMAIIASLDRKALQAIPPDKIATIKSLQELRINTAYCLAVWFAETRGYGFDRLCQLLYNSLWRPAAETKNGGTDRLRMLTQIEDLGGVGLAATIFKQQAGEQAVVTAAVRKEMDVLRVRYQHLEEQNRRLQEQGHERKARIAQLEQDIAEEHQRHSHTRIHLGDEHEQLRTRLLRRLKDETALLVEGLNALQREPPKIHVMEDFAERALEGLKKEIQELEK